MEFPKKTTRPGQEKLHLSFEPVIERAHRTGTRSRLVAADGINTRPRSIVCRLRDWKQKDEILRAWYVFE